jgi:hypothetical protein
MSISLRPCCLPASCTDNLPSLSLQLTLRAPIRLACLQMVEALTTTAFAHSFRRMVLVGDPKQLPAVVRSKWSTAAGYSRSLMERLIDQGHPYLLLNTQVRNQPGAAAG